MSTAATETTRRTRPSNASTQPGKVVLEAQVKRCSKAQKAADNLTLKEAKEALFKKGLECLTHIETEMEKKNREKCSPRRPPPFGLNQGPKSMLDDLPEANEIDNHQKTPTEDMDDGPATTGKGKRRCNMQKKHNKSLSNVEDDSINNKVPHTDGKDTLLIINVTAQKLTLGGRVTNWALAITEYKKLEPSPRASSFSTREPPLTIFSPNTASSIATSATQPPTQIPAAQTKHVTDDALTGALGDEIDDSLEYEATCKEKQDKGKTKQVVSIFDENSDFDEPQASQGLLQYDDSELELSQEPRALFTQAPNLKSSKRKANKILVSAEVSEAESMVSDWSMEVKGVNNLIMCADELSQPEPIVVTKEKVSCTTTSTSVTTSVADSEPPAQKKAKIKPSAASVRGVSAKLKCQQNVPVDTMPKHMKACGAYHTVDLPAAMQADQRWTKKYLPTIMLWAGSYEDIWVIPDDVLLHHAQLIFDAVYKDLNIVLIHNGVVHSPTAQRISEWRSNFGSTAIVIVMDFMTRNPDCPPSDMATSLVHDWAFVYENPGSPSPLTAYCSPFILQLIGMAHLNTIKGYVEVPSFNMHELVTSRMSRVLALSAVAIKRALGLIKNKQLKVQDVLLSASRSKVAIKLPKVLNKMMGKEINVPFLFSATLWSKPTKAFIKSILSKPAGYVEATIEMAHTTVNDATDTVLSLLDDEESDKDERAMICEHGPNHLGLLSLTTGPLLQDIIFVAVAIQFALETLSLIFPCYYCILCLTSASHVFRCIMFSIALTFLLTLLLNFTLITLSSCVFHYIMFSSIALTFARIVT
ncbi:uncharacterized protein F5147DRAFT_774418 [Suillus discolor]|uniref:Uncharacterized protein n=1 Tax=Suillus discolor TaxID=1912936 RepID=A0A9P7JTC8_9AGAM|nr:uncharacterized protein F5147DRAFT_774418 [Suillus discolor]KAG2107197.1 hypothetical protein F5147DRAFT_774418 [Suillus discolor]